MLETVTLTKLDKRVVLLDLGGMYHIQGVIGPDHPYPSTLEDGTGIASHMRTTARAIIYRELTQRLTAIVPGHGLDPRQR